MHGHFGYIISFVILFPQSLKPLCQLNFGRADGFYKNQHWRKIVKAGTQGEQKSTQEMCYNENKTFRLDIIYILILEQTKLKQQRTGSRRKHTNRRLRQTHSRWHVQMLPASKKKARRQINKADEWHQEKPVSGEAKIFIPVKKYNSC